MHVFGPLQMSLVVADQRKRAWVAIRGLEAMFRDKLIAAVTDRWGAWFGSDEFDPLEIAKVCGRLQTQKLFRNTHLLALIGTVIRLFLKPCLLVMLADSTLLTIHRSTPWISRCFVKSQPSIDYQPCMLSQAAGKQRSDWQLQVSAMQLTCLRHLL